MTHRNDRYRNYAASYSTDHGVSWSSSPIPMEGTGCARPRLKRLPGDEGSSSGPLLLTGGRLCVENKTGIFLWVNNDGMAGYLSSAGSGLGSGSGSGAAAAASKIAGGMSMVPASTWERHSITAQHNRLWKGDPAYLFSQMVRIALSALDSRRIIYMLVSSSSFFLSFSRPLLFFLFNACHFDFETVSVAVWLFLAQKPRPSRDCCLMLPAPTPAPTFSKLSFFSFASC